MATVSIQSLLSNTFASGYSGTPGTSGYSGVGTVGASGYSGVGTSGYSGATGAGTSGYSGVSGYSGQLGTSGYSGLGGAGASGYSGVQGFSGYSGSGASGFSGYSGTGGTGASGYSGVQGFSGYSGAAGSGSGFTYQEITVDWGTIPVLADTWSIAVSGLLINQRILAQPSGYSPAGVYMDEAEFESINYTAKCLVNGTLVITGNSTSAVKGQRYVQLYITG